MHSEEKGIQYRFTISEFRNKQYMGIREWYMNFEGEFVPTTNGVTFPYELDIVSRLFNAFTKILARAEVLLSIKTASDEYDKEIPKDPE